MLCLSSCFNKFIILLSSLLKKHFWVWGSIFFKAVFGLSFHVLCFLLPEITGNGKGMAFNWEYVPNSLLLSCIHTSKILLDLLLTGFILLVQGQSPFHHGWLDGMTLDVGSVCKFKDLLGGERMVEGMRERDVETGRAHRWTLHYHSRSRLEGRRSTPHYWLSVFFLCSQDLGRQCIEWVAKPSG